MPAPELRLERLLPATDESLVRAALELVLRQLPEAVRSPFIDGLLTARRHDPQSLGLVWRGVGDGGELLGATWAQLRVGGSAVVWPPQWIEGRRPAEPDPLLAALLDSLADCGVRSAECLLPDRDGDDARALLGCGFRHLADLLYLAAEVAPHAPPSPMNYDVDLQFDPIDATNVDRLAAIVAATYRGTLDCPTLDEQRSPHEILDDYRRTGDSGDRFWRLLRHRNVEVGCLILAEHRNQRQLELAYMGIVPESRGKNWGEATVREALRIATSRGLERVVLAVDAANFPARAVYERCGFVPFEARTALVCSLPRERRNVD